MTTRSNRADVRNPMLRLPDVQALYAGLPPEARQALVDMLRAISKASRVQANALWAAHKAPMAAYWKAKAVDCRHLALAGAGIDSRKSTSSDVQHTTGGLNG